MKNKDLKIWQKSMSLVTKVYAVTQKFPDLEKFGLTSQIRRCAVSVPSNIAEGNGRRSNKELSQFLIISRGSLSELETQLTIAKNLKYISEEILLDLEKDMTELFKMIHSFSQTLT